MNEVRNRAGMPDGLTERAMCGKMRQLVRRERKVEFAFAGLHLIDLRRWDIGALVNSQPIRDAEEIPAVFKGSSSVQKLPKFGEKGRRLRSERHTSSDPEASLVRDKNAMGAALPVGPSRRARSARPA